MAPILPTSDACAFEDLEDFLMSDRVPDDCMQLSDLDGFLTGVVVSPELIMPSEWLPRVWGNGDPEFESEAEASRVIGAIMGRYNEIAGQLGRGGDGELDPVFWENQNGDVIAGDWAEGFMDAVKLRPGDWVALFEDEEMRPGISPILALVSDEEGKSLLDIDREELKEIRLEAASEIPGVVLEIDRFWKARRAHGHLCSRHASSI